MAPRTSSRSPTPSSSLGGRGDDSGNTSEEHSTKSNWLIRIFRKVLSRPKPTGIEAGTEKDSRRGDLLNIAKQVFQVAGTASDAIPVVGGFVGVVAKVGLTIVEMAQDMNDNNETADRLGNHAYRLSEVLEKFRNQSQHPKTSEATDGMNGLRGELQNVQDQIKELQSQADIQKFFKSGDQSETLKTLHAKVQTALEQIQLLLSLNTSILMDELHNENMQSKHRHLLDRLGDGKYGVRGYTVEDAICLAGTRVEILNRIDGWIRGASISERVLWIRGMAGRGKSTIASTVAHSWEGRACCALYHFRRGQNAPGNSLVCTLARQIGKGLDPELRKAIVKAVEENDDIANQRPEKQFNALFVAPLGILKQKKFPVLIIVDALDECDSVGDAC